MMVASRLSDYPTLEELVADLAPLGPAVAETVVTGVTLDNRQVVPGGLFLACAGIRRHGLDYAEAAVAAGACCILAEPAGEWPEARIRALVTRLAVPVVPVPGLGMHAGDVAARFYGDPSARMRIIGVTGTNGKTSCTHFLAQALHGRERCALLGTLGNGFVDALGKATHTTPDAPSVQRLLSDFAEAGAGAAAMEVSSHALHQHRVGGVRFEVGVFTNLSRDHLDYHGTMDAYADAKARLFRVPGLKAAVINADDGLGQRLLATLPPGVQGIAYGVGLSQHAGFDRWLGATSIRATAEGLELDIVGSAGRGLLRTGVLGRFNAYNLLAVLGALLALDVPFSEALERIATVRGVPGRMELFRAPGRPAAVVDYAHTPDALEQALHAARAHCAGRLWCLFGCGGDRDRGKRPLMGAVAERLADVAVVTSDNPRSEDPDAIIADILGGMSEPAEVRVEPDRARAIAGALGEAAPEDWVLIAGKGHEDYQIVGDRVLPFSDRDQVRRALTGVAS